MPKYYSRIIYSALVLAAVIAIGLVVLRDGLEIKDIGTGLLALLGTVVGATLVFRLNEDREREREQAAHRTALNSALFVLARQWNALNQLARDIEQYKTPFDRAFNLPALKPPSYADLVHRFEALDFLLGSPDVNTLFRLSIEQERFQQAIASLGVRNDFYVGELQPVIAKLQLNGKSLTLTDAETALGERLFGTAMRSADSFNSHILESLKSLRDMHRELRALAKKLYPDYKFVDFHEEA